jgi:hypothetical protein
MSDPLTALTLTNFTLNLRQTLTTPPLTQITLKNCLRQGRQGSFGILISTRKIGASLQSK